MFEITLLIIVLASTLGGYYWVLTHYFSASNEGAVLLLAPVALLASLAAIYYYYLGWVRYRQEMQASSANRLFYHVGGMVVVALLVFLQAVAAIYCVTRNNMRLATLLALTASITAVWGIVRVQNRVGRTLAYEREEQSDKNWRIFERRFRIFVFGLILVLPSGLALFSLLALQDLPVTALFALIAVAIAPWVIRKIRTEVQNQQNEDLAG